MARLTDEQWREARRLWESDPREGFDWLAETLGGIVSRQAISKKAKKDGWTKGGAQEVAQLSATMKKVAQPNPQPKKAAAKEPPPDVEQEFIPAMEPADRMFEKIVRPVGRPTEYHPEYAEWLIDFFKDHLAYREETEIGESGHRKRIWIVPNKPPTLMRFAAIIGVCRDTLYNWAHAKDVEGRLKYPEFFRAYKRAQTIQEAILIEGGLTGAFNSGMTAFLLKNLAGYKDHPEETEEDMLADTQEDRRKRQEAYERALDKAAMDKERMLARCKSLSARPVKVENPGEDEGDG